MGQTHEISVKFIFSYTYLISQKKKILYLIDIFDFAMNFYSFRSREALLIFWTRPVAETHLTVENFNFFLPKFNNF
jgi:hypothetical protein